MMNVLGLGLVFCFVLFFLELIAQVAKFINTTLICSYTLLLYFQ